jgi:hypothetical protein
MAVQRGNSVDEVAVKKLTAREIARRIQRLTSHLGAQREEAVSGTPLPDDLHPRLIAPAELVRRLRRFVVYN